MKQATNTQLDAVMKALKENSQVRVICEGLDSKCYKVICFGRVYIEEGIYVMESDGVSFNIDESDLQGYMVDTPENRKLFKEKMKANK